MLSNSPFPQLDHLPPVHASTSPGEAVADMRVHHETERRAMGYDAGYQEGLAAGRADASRHVAGLVAALDSAAVELRRQDASDVETVAHEAVELALMLAEAIIGREVAASVHPGRDGLIRALALAPSTGELVAHLHPNDLGSIGDISQLGGGRELTLLADASVESGGCVLQVGATRINSQIGPALERVRAELLSEELLTSYDPEPTATGTGTGTGTGTSDGSSSYLSDGAP